MNKKQKTKSKKNSNFKSVAYYAHSMIKYGSSEEKEELDFISKLPGIYKIINPALIKNRGIGMQQYYRLIDECDVVIFSEYKEHIGAGVYEEVEYAISNNKVVYLLRGKSLYECKDGMCRMVDGGDWFVKYARVIIPKAIGAAKINPSNFKID